MFTRMIFVCCREIVQVENEYLLTECITSFKISLCVFSIGTRNSLMLSLG